MRKDFDIGLDSDDVVLTWSSATCGAILFVYTPRPSRKNSLRPKIWFRPDQAV